MVREPPVGVGSHVEAWPQAEFAAAHHETVDDITTIGGVHHTVVGVLRIPEAEATLVMGSQTHLAGSHCHRRERPLISVHDWRIEDRCWDAFAQPAVLAHAVVLVVVPRVDVEVDEE